MNIDSIRNISESPFWISETLPFFFDGYGKDKIDFNILYLIPPFLLTRSLREDILLTANSKSSFDSLFFNVSSKSKAKMRVLSDFNESLFNKTSLITIEEKYHNYKNIIDKSILIAYAKGYLDIQNGSIVPLRRKDYTKERKTEDFLYDYFKCSRNLGIIFTKESTENLFRKCQIREIII